MRYIEKEKIRLAYIENEMYNYSIFEKEYA